jgi:hypothetical protein
LIYVRRTLWYVTHEGRHEQIVEDELLGRGECLVVLGEPGMGKSSLLRHLAATAGLETCTARQLINRSDPRTLLADGTLIVIDALDEVAAQRDGTAVDIVLQRLGTLGHPRFILSCRVADWQAATSVAAIREQYPAEPLQLHLEPLGREQQMAILADQVGDEPWAHELIEHFETHGLDFLGNPQTLDLVARLPRHEPLPMSRSALFDLAVEQLRVEHRDGRDRQELPHDAALAAAGAAFAALILSGASTIRRAGQANLREGEIPASEVDDLAGGHLAQVLGTRLFAGGQDKFSYWHRRIGEFLGAAWLARRADTSAKRRRLLQMFHVSGLVPTSLRGLHAWLARDPHLAEAIMAADPIGVVEYGDADVLTSAQFRKLFEALEHLAQKDPHFWRRGSLRARRIVTGQLEEETLRVLRDRQAPVAFRLLLLEQITEANHAEPYRDVLRQLLRDDAEGFAVRWQSGTALAMLDGEDWPSLVEGLRKQADRDSVRLAYEIMRTVGLAAFSDHHIAEVILTFDGLLQCAWPREEPERLAARFWNLPQIVPRERLESLLDVFAGHLSELLPRYTGIEHNELIDAFIGLVLRRLDLGLVVDPLRLWGWLQPLSKTSSYQRNKCHILAEHLRSMDEGRRAIQRHVMLDATSETMGEKHVRLVRVSPGLALDESDVVDLLSALEAPALDDERWFDVLRFVPHDSERGRAAREFAERLVGNDMVRRARIASLTDVVVPEWKIEQEARARSRAAQRTEQFALARDDFRANIDSIRGGDPRWLCAPAEAYLRRFSDLGEGVPAHERVAEWLGPDIASAAHEGFEAFLCTTPPRPSATRMALSFANSRRYAAGEIIVAALAERLRVRTKPFADLPDDRLMAGLFDLWDSLIEKHAGLTGLVDRLETELRMRGAWELAVRLFVGAQVRRRREHVNRLHQLMRDDRDAALATALALEWLWLYPDLPAAAEAPLIDRVLHSPRRYELGAIGEARRQALLDDERRRNWDAVALILDLDAASARLGGMIEPDLLWHIRSRTASGRRNDHSQLPLDPRQISWIVMSFRRLWPARGWPSGVSTGDTNPWNATEYLSSLIARLGEDTSDEAVAAIAALADAPPDGYTSHIRAVATEQQRKRVDLAYAPASLHAIASIVNDGPATDAADLQAVMLENIQVAQDMIRGSDVDWYRGFFRENGRHKDEESCRDELIKMLRTIDGQLEYIPESHGADDRRVDIVVRANGRLILPIEIKGVWHRDLWTAADAQLDHRYVNDWRAERGIYLVLWFGDAVRGTPAGIAVPRTPGELREALRATSGAAQAGRVDIVVLDLTRPT